MATLLQCLFKPELSREKGRCPSTPSIHFFFPSSLKFSHAEVTLKSALFSSSDVGMLSAPSFPSETEQCVPCRAELRSLQCPQPAVLPALHPALSLRQMLLSLQFALLIADFFSFLLLFLLPFFFFCSRNDAVGSEL